MYHADGDTQNNTLSSTRPPDTTITTKLSSNLRTITKRQEEKQADLKMKGVLKLKTYIYISND